MVFYQIVYGFFYVKHICGRARKRIYGSLVFFCKGRRHATFAMASLWVCVFNKQSLSTCYWLIVNERRRILKVSYVFSDFFDISVFAWIIKNNDIFRCAVFVYYKWNSCPTFHASARGKGLFHFISIFYYFGGFNFFAVTIGKREAAGHYQ